ncbi:putative adipose-regulatory protein-domain-containing protein [Lasiosphaeria ovina]|uniref:Adipose-regulatory protein-domain-containing protein n=1 Tax=Lasiosphaeria ovina TaxID=92902 RepID=A0AAE0NMN1_9PEZI|nr:putative adipose-regulatory protein-domain-containing protein [Lasiosphaeria ovina]
MDPLEQFQANALAVIAYLYSHARAAITGSPAFISAHFSAFKQHLAWVRHNGGSRLQEVLRAIATFVLFLVYSSRVKQGLIILALAVPTIFIQTILMSAVGTVGYVMMYNRIIPDVVARVPVYLQYGYGPNPFGVARIRNVKTRQAYDISVSLTLPRSPPNLELGNFMVTLEMLGEPSPLPKAAMPVTAYTPESALKSSADLHRTALVADRPVLFFSARPALIPFWNKYVSFASRMLFFPYHALFDTDKKEMVIPMAENIYFRSHSSVPTRILVEVQAGQRLQVYAAEVKVTARLSGLVWFMYHFRLATFVAMLTGFLILSSMVSALIFLATMFWWPWPQDPPGGGGGGGNTLIGNNDGGNNDGGDDLETSSETPGLSGTGPTLTTTDNQTISATDNQPPPTTGNQSPPDKFGWAPPDDDEDEVKSEIKSEEKGEGTFSVLAPELPAVAPGAEADDEDGSEEDPVKEEEQESIYTPHMPHASQTIDSGIGESNSSQTSHIGAGTRAKPSASGGGA